LGLAFSLLGNAHGWRNSFVPFVQSMVKSLFT
jgi:hypothetical protein